MMADSQEDWRRRPDRTEDKDLFLDSAVQSGGDVRGVHRSSSMLYYLSQRHGGLVFRLTG